jgi:hypothetical protein
MASLLLRVWRVSDAVPIAATGAPADTPTRTSIWPIGGRYAE